MNFKSLTLTYGNVAVALPSNRYPLPSILGNFPCAEHHIKLVCGIHLEWPSAPKLSSDAGQYGQGYTLFLFSFNNHVSHVT